MLFCIRHLELVIAFLLQQESQGIGILNLSWMLRNPEDSSSDSGNIRAVIPEHATTTRSNPRLLDALHLELISFYFYAPI
jgi:hypothetical protein